MNKFFATLKQEAQALHFNGQGIKAVGFLAKDAILTLKEKYLKVLCFDFLAAILNAGAYVLTLNVLQQIEGTDHNKSGFLENIFSNTGLHIASLVLIIFFICCSVELRYRSFTTVCSIWEAFAVRCTTLGVQAINRKINLETSIDSSIDTPNSNNKNRQLLNKMVNRDAFSTGLFAKKIAQILSGILQALIFLIVLMYLNTSITLIILLLSSLLVIFYIHSYLNVARASNTRQDLTELSKDEMKNLYEDIESGDLTDKEVGEKIQGRLFNGNIGKLLHQKIYVQKSIKRGASIIEYANPLTLLVIGIILFNTEYFNISISALLIYFLLLRKMIGIAVQIGDEFISINRIHPDITNYLVVTGKIQPSE